MPDRVRDVDIGEQEQEIVLLALTALQLALRLNVHAILGTDSFGDCVIPRPGSERKVMRYLSSVDWKSALRQCEEFVP